MSEGVTMAKRRRRAFTDEFRAETVRFVHESVKSISAAARELDLSENAVRDWVRRADEAKAGRRVPTSVPHRQPGRRTT